MIFVSVLMIGLATAQIAVDAQNIFVAFVDKDRAERIAFLMDVSQPLFTYKHAIFICQTVVGDFFVVSKQLRTSTERVEDEAADHLVIPDIPLLHCLGKEYMGCDTPDRSVISGCWCVPHQLVN
jgi:hypothetical protein